MKRRIDWFGWSLVAVVLLGWLAELHGDPPRHRRSGRILPRLRAPNRIEPRSVANVANQELPPRVDRKKSLAEALDGADRLVVSPVAADESQEVSKFTIDGKQKILDLLAVIEINEQASGYHCLCYGDHLLRFYKENALVATISHHHGVSLRWHDDRWEGDGELTSASQAAFPRWFREQGFAAFYDAREAQLAEERRRAAQTERFLACFPARARPLFESPESLASLFVAGGRDQRQSEIGRQVVHAIGGGQAATVCVSRALGTLDRRDASWFMEEALVSRALAVGNVATGAEFAAGVAQFKGDRKAELGAARLFFEQDFQSKVAAGSRAALAVQLATAVLESDLDRDKSFVIRRLQQIRDPRVIDFLRKVMHGEVGKEPEPSTTWDEEPGLMAAAALSLAVLGDKGIQDKLHGMLSNETNESDQAALRIGLALLGEPSQLEASHFKRESYNIGLAGIKAIEQWKGSHGMDELVLGALSHPYGEVREQAELAFQRLTNTEFKEIHVGDAIRTWWKEHRNEFLESKTLKATK